MDAPALKQWLYPWLARPQALWLLLVFPLLGAAATWAAYRRRRGLLRLGAFVPAEGARSRGAGFLQSLCRTAGLVALVLAVAGPQWGRDQSEATAPGRDVIVALDASRSMLARDMPGRSSPSRLGWARDALKDLADRLQERGGHRIGLVVFAGRARLVCPLTEDYDHFREALAATDADDPAVAPEPADGGPVSGTRIGEGLRLAADLHTPDADGRQDLLLVSDGDDPVADGEWRTGAAEARRRGMRVDVVGVGDPADASPVPLGDGVLRGPDGTRVLTRLEEKPLREIAASTGGIYVPAGRKDVALGRLYRETLQARATRDRDEHVPVYRPQDVWFFAGALVFLTGDMLVGGRPRRQRRHAEEASEPLVAV